MLEQYNPVAPGVAIALELTNQPLSQLLAALLPAWDYPLTAAPKGKDLLLSERLCGDSQLALRSTDNMTLANLAIPLCLPQLYEQLALLLHQEKPGHQLRARAALPLQVQVRGQNYQCQTVQISDRGLRFSLPVELARGERLELQLQLGSRQYQLSGTVVYVLQGKELGWGDRVDIGTIFQPLAATTREYILAWIISHTLQQLPLDKDILQAALESVELPLASQKLLGRL